MLPPTTNQPTTTTTMNQPTLVPTKLSPNAGTTNHTMDMSGMDNDGSGNRTFVLRESVNLQHQLEAMCQQIQHMSILDKYSVNSFQELLSADQILAKDDLQALAYTLNWMEHHTFLKFSNQKKRTHNGREAYRCGYHCLSCGKLCLFSSADDKNYRLSLPPAHSAECSPSDALYSPLSNGMVPKGAQPLILKNLRCVNDSARRIFQVGGGLKNELDIMKNDTSLKLGAIPQSTWNSIIDGKKKMCFDNNNMSGYSKLAFYLDEFCQMNPGSMAALQLDSLGRFLRAIVVPIHTLTLFRRGILQPAMSIDAGHSKTLYYDGIYKVGVVPAGTGDSIPVFLSVGPVEDTNNACWDILFLELASYQLESFALPCDRGGFDFSSGNIGKGSGSEPQHQALWPTLCEKCEQPCRDWQQGGSC